jgi:hypothetical protein
MEQILLVSGESAPTLFAPFLRLASIWAGERGIFTTRRLGFGSFRGSAMAELRLIAREVVGCVKRTDLLATQHAGALHAPYRDGHIPGVCPIRRASGPNQEV